MTGTVACHPPLDLPPRPSSLPDLSRKTELISPTFHSKLNLTILENPPAISSLAKANYWGDKTIQDLSALRTAPTHPYNPRPASPISKQGNVSILGLRHLSPLLENGEDDLARYTSIGIVQIPSPVFSRPLVCIRSATPIALPSLLERDEYQQISQNIQSISELTEEEKTRLTHYICANRNALFEKATSSGKNVRLYCHDHQLPRTVLVTPDKQIFVLLNQVVAKDDTKIAEGFSKKIKFCHEVTKGIVAVAGSSSQVEEVTKEFEMLSKFRGTPGIIEALALDTYISKLGQQKAVLITPYYKEKDLFHVVIEEGKVFSEEEARSLLLVLANALQAVHQERIVHRDIKLENILLDATKDPVLCDFGLARTIGDTNGGYTVGGTPMYFHPKYAEAYLRTINSGENHDALLALTTPSLDIWALGVLAFTISNTRVLGWTLIHDPIDTCRAIANLKEGWLPEPQDKSSLQHLIWKMLQVDFAKQISLPEIIAFLQAE